jgi:hypothetical protein
MLGFAQRHSLVSLAYGCADIAGTSRRRAWLAISPWFSPCFGLSYPAQSECSPRKMNRSIDKIGAKLPNNSYACEPIQSYLDM